VEHDFAPPNGVVNPLVALDVSLDELNVVGDVQEVLATPGGEIVYCANLVARGQQRIDEMRADETPAPGDENSHGATVSQRPLASPGW
jgi:hypothetical protein